ncbi:NAD-dependent epimerase/dehydratase family protein [Telmatobacter bradus]|uniref:NAD-dependent epimerase/dehydratase family protein n=1 Tax=Telmatobacter bradus TaxID=474953 RepID=UPI003B42F73E
MNVFVTGGTGHIGSYIIPDLTAAGHEVTGLARSDASAAAVSALGAKVLRGDISYLDGLKAEEEESDGVNHVAHRQDLLSSGGIDAVAAVELQIMLAYGEVLAGTGKPLVVSGRIGSPTNIGWAAPEARFLSRTTTEEAPALSGGVARKGIW